MVVVVVPDNFECSIIDRFLFHHSSYHVRVDELINFFNGNIHPMVSRYMSLKFKKLPAHIVYIDKAKLFMNIVLCYVDVEMVKPVLVKS